MVIAKDSSFVFWAKRREKLAGNSVVDFGIGLSAPSSEEHTHFAPSVRIFDTEKGILRSARPLFNKQRSGEVSRFRVMRRGDTEFHFSAVCSGRKSTLGGTGSGWKQQPIVTLIENLIV